MTTDDFAEAARAEAERYFADPGVDPLTLSVIDHAMHMAEWARTHLAAHDARVKRDAAREALDGLVQKFQWGGWSDTLKRGSQPIDLMGNANRVTGWMRDYRDTHYPETEDQT